MRRRVLVSLLPLLLAGCPGPTESGDDGEGDIEVRIANESSLAFEGVDVVFPEDSVDYGAIAAHGMSAYRGVSSAYRYALIIVQVGGEELRLQPIDYVGEEPLIAGRYTYALNVSVEGHLRFTFRSDQ